MHHPITFEWVTRPDEMRLSGAGKKDEVKQALMAASWK